MLFYCGKGVVTERTNVPDRTRRYVMTAIYDTQTNRLDFYTNKGLRQLVIREGNIKGLAAIKVKFKEDSMYEGTFVSTDDKGAYIAGNKPIRSPFEDKDIYISSPVILGTLRKGMDFHYKNLHVKIQEAIQNGQYFKVVAVSFDFGSVMTNTKSAITYQEYYNQVVELMSCFVINNSKLLCWKITTPLTDVVSTDCYLNLKIGKHRVKTMLVTPIQGATYLRYSVNDNTDCHISSPTRTVEILDLRNNEQRVNSCVLIDSKVVEVLKYFGTILLSVDDESYINQVRNFFKTSATIYYLGQFDTLNDFYKHKNTRAASVALMTNNKKVFFIANIKEKG